MNRPIRDPETGVVEDPMVCTRCESVRLTMAWSVCADCTRKALHDLYAPEPPPGPDPWGWPRCPECGELHNIEACREVGATGCDCCRAIVDREDENR